MFKEKDYFGRRATDIYIFTCYDSANRLISVNSSEIYTYNALGDRLTQNNIHYMLDLNAGLTQVLDDGGMGSAQSLLVATSPHPVYEVFKLGRLPPLPLGEGRVRVLRRRQYPKGKIHLQNFSVA